MATQKANLFESLRGLVEAAGHHKTAAGNPPDPGSIGGATTHPVADLDNGCKSVSTGARASEYETDIKKDQGAPGVDSTAEGVVGDQSSAQLNIGTTQSATGEDPSIEDAYKDGKDDPGSEMEARTDNSALDGKKYASMSFDQMHKAASNIANLLLADTVTGYFPLTTSAEETGASGTAAEDSAATTDAAPTGEEQPPEPSKESPTGEGVFAEPGSKSASEYDALLKQAVAAIAGKQTTSSGMTPEMEAGYKLAGAVGLSVKEAQVYVAQTMESTINDAAFDAGLVGDYLVTIKQAVEEAAGEDNDDDADDSSGKNHSDGAGGAPSEGDSSGGGESGGESGGGGGDDIAALLGGGGGSSPEAGGSPGGMEDAGAPPAPSGSLGDILGGGGDPGGMMPPPADPAAGLGGGAPPMGAPPMGGDPGMGGPPMGAPPMGGDPGMGGPPMGGGDQEAAIAELVAALQELGISPEELAQSGPPPAQPGEMSEGMKLASVAKGFMRSGKYRVKEAGEKTSARKLRDTFKRHLVELCSR